MSDSRITKQIARAFYESYNRKDLQASFAKYISPELIYHGDYDRAGWLATDSALLPAFADFSLTVLDQVAEGDKVSTRFQLGGTQTGELFGIPASGRTAFVHGTATDRVAHGQIVEHWADTDVTTFLQTLSAPSDPK